MTDPRWIGAALAAIVLIGSVRLLWPRRAASPMKGSRIAALLVLQVASAVVLYLTLVPPQTTGRAGQLTVLTANAQGLRWPQVPGETVIALPEATPTAGSAPAPDLATALRQHPGTRALRLVGDGLPARDRDSALPAQLSLVPAAPPRGWVGLQPPAPSAPGAPFEVRARAQGVADASAELLDPAGLVVDRARLAADGQVTLQGVARAVGRSEFSLRLLDAARHTVETVPVPLQTVAQPAPRVLIIAGAPGPELKYLRRWAVDTGLSVQAQANAGGGVSLGDAPVALTAARLAETDVLILDERSLAALGAGQRGAVQQALRSGLGVLVRSTGPLPEGARQTLRGWGLALAGNNQATAVALPADPEPALLQARRGPARPAAHATPYAEEADGVSRHAAMPELEQFALRATDATALLRDARGQPVGSWRRVGQGRLALLPVTDSYRSVLAGRDDRHAELWSSILATLARPLPATPALRIDHRLPWAGERLALCNLAGPAFAQGPDGRRVPVLVDPATAGERCAGYWPQQPGWHAVQQGELSQVFYVFDAGKAAALHRQQTREATGLRIGAASNLHNIATVTVPGPRWPWLLAFVLVAGLLWWLERRRTTAV